MSRFELSELFRQAPAFIAILRGPDHVFELTNDAYLQLVGHRDLIGKAVGEAIPEVRDQVFIDLLDEVVRTGQPYIGNEMPIVLQVRPGAPPEPRFVNFIYQPLTDDAGRVSGIFVHGVDVTEQVRARQAVDLLNDALREQTTVLESQAEELQATAEELHVSTEELSERTSVAEDALDAAQRATAALTASKNRYRMLTEAVPVQVWTARPDGMLDFVSASTARYFGVDEADVLGVGWTRFVHPDDLPTAAGRWTASLETGDAYQAEFRLLHAESGEYRWHLARALCERDEEGRISGWIGSNTDVEDERRARAEAEAANKSKSDFLAVMSHELRTPLNAIGGYTQLLSMGIRGPVTDAQHVDLEKIQRSQRHLLGLIGGILNYAKIDAGAVQYDIENVALAEVLNVCEALTLPQLREKSLHLERTNAAAECVALADREKVQQILLNLLSNAIKFTDAGGSITLTCTVEGEWVVVRVRDTGRGIAAAQLERVFEPFIQVDARFTRDQTGTGLGLAISRELARGMDGDLTAQSELGVGSVFTLHLRPGQG